MKRTLITLLIVPALAGCSGVRHGLIDATGAAGGAYLGHTLSHGDPLITAAGAAGGVVAAEAGQAVVSSGQKRSYQSGYEKGRSDSVKSWNEDLRRDHRVAPER